NQFHANRDGVVVSNADVGGGGATYNTIADNNFTANDYPIYFGVIECIYSSCMQGNQVSQISFVGNHGSGVYFNSTGCTGDTSFGCDPVNVLITGNLFFGNGNDGISAVGPANNRVTIDHNSATFNTDLGIDAPDAIDGGG